MRGSCWALAPRPASSPAARWPLPIAQSRPERANFLLSLFYAGPGIGILASGLIAPFTLQFFGPGSWWIVWWAMTLLSVVMTVPLFLIRIESGARFSQGSHARLRPSPRC